MSTTTYLPTTVLTPCPSWCDHHGVGHEPDPWGDESVTMHERRISLPAGFGQVAVIQQATGEEASEPPTLDVDLGVAEMDLKDGEALVATLTAAVEALRQARAAR